MKSNCELVFDLINENQNISNNELYKELLKDYPKTTIKKSYISFKVK